jgi:hypothetical protein
MSNTAKFAVIMPKADFDSIEAELRRRAIAAAGSFRSGASDLSTNHDKYPGEN